MTDENRDESDEAFGLFEALFETLRRAAEEGGVEGRGRVGDDATGVDFSYSVRTGLGSGADGRRGHPRFGSDGTRRNPAGPAGSGDDRRPTGRAPDRDDSSSTPAPPVHVDTTGEGRTVTVDLADEGVTDSDEVCVTAGGGVLSVDGVDETLATVPLGDGEWTVTDLAVNNGVLRAEVAADG